MLKIEEIFQVISINVKRWEHSLVTWKNLRFWNCDPLYCIVLCVVSVPQITHSQLALSSANPIHRHACLSYSSIGMYQILVYTRLQNGVTFSQIFFTYRWQHDVVRSNPVTNPRDHNILLLGTICLFIYNHTKELEFYLFADWLQDLWGRLQLVFNIFAIGSRLGQ